MMQTLVERAAYDVDETGYWKRLQRFLMVFYGGGMGLFVFFSEEGGVLERLLYALVAATAGGVLYRALMIAWLRRATRRALDRIHAGDERLVGPPPAEREYPYRLPCGYLATPRRCVGGVLYLGHGDLLFVPNRNGPPRYREPVRLGPLRAVRVSVATPPLNPMARLLSSREPRALVLALSEGTHQFIVPAADRTALEVERTIALLSAPPAAPGREGPPSDPAGLPGS